jgi:signal transduction histidine kinase
MAQDINGCSRVLLHNETDDDAVLVVLGNLQRVTAVHRVALFQKHIAADNEIVFDWRYQIDNMPTVNDPCCAGRPTAPCEAASETAARLAQGQPVRLDRPAEDAGEGLDRNDGHATSALVLPIRVFSEWWGGLFLSGGDPTLFEDQTITQAFGAAADLFGIHFERQIAARENITSDKLVGALEMAGTVCHKLNQPMQVILGYASMVTSGDISEPEQICEIVKMIENETRRMGIITKNLMGITQYRSVEALDAGSMCDSEVLPS